MLELRVNNLLFFGEGDCHGGVDLGDLLVFGFEPFL
jgi:hypothetical protein